MFTPLRHVNTLLWKQRPIQLTYFVTRRCNAKCPYCFYLQGDNNVNSERPELQLDEIQKISASMGKLLWLAFSGGEIFLRRDLPEISRVFYENNKPVYLLYPTNGMMPELIRGAMERILEICKNSVVIVKLSIDGLYEQHDQLRNTPGSFAKTLRTYELLSPLLSKYTNFELGVNTVFCAQNQDSMQDILEYVASLKHITTHTLSLVRGNLKQPDYQQVDINKYWHYAQKLADNIQRNRSPQYRFSGAKLKTAQDILQRKLIRDTHEKQRRLIPCYAGKANLVLTEQGGLYPCESFSQSFGNVRDYQYNISHVLQSQQAQTIIKSIHDKQCFCTHECYFITNIMLNPWLYPAVLREYFKLDAA